VHFKSFHLLCQGIIENIKRVHSIITKDQRISSGEQVLQQAGEAKPDNTVGKAEQVAEHPAKAAQNGNR
jgi:hypothetical protein